MSTQAQAETEIVQGIVGGIVAKGQDKWQVEVNTGGQNPRRLWTKDPALVAGLQTVIGTQQSFLCGVSHWTNQQGQPVRSLWINGVGQGAAVAQPPAATPPQQPVWQGATPAPAPPQQVHVQPQAFPMQGMQPQTFPQPTQQAVPVATMQPRYQDPTEPKIHRQTASKVAVHLLKHLSPEHQTFDTLIALCERLVAYYDHGVQRAAPADGNPGQQQMPVPNPAGYENPAEYGDYQPPPPGDDDIPF